MHRYPIAACAVWGGPKSARRAPAKRIGVWPRGALKLPPSDRKTRSRRSVSAARKAASHSEPLDEPHRVRTGSRQRKLRFSRARGSPPSLEYAPPRRFRPGLVRTFGSQCAPRDRSLK